MEKQITKIQSALLDYTKNRTDEGDLQALADNIKEYGLQFPLLVIDRGEKYSRRYLIIDGRRRFKAGLLLSMEEFPCIVLTEEERKGDLDLIMNTHRLQLNPVDLYRYALAYVKDVLKEDPQSLPADKIKMVAQRLNIDKGMAMRILNIGRMAPDVISAIIANEIPLRLALLTIGTKDFKTQKRFLAYCKSEKPSTREAVDWFDRDDAPYGSLMAAMFNVKLICKGCKYRGMTNVSLFEDVAKSEEDQQNCWNKPCFEKHQQEVISQRLNEFRKAHPHIRYSTGDLYDWHLNEAVKVADIKKCQTCKKIVMTYNRYHDAKFKAVCPPDCDNIKGLRKIERDSSTGETKHKPSVKDENLTKTQKKEIITDRLGIAVRKQMIDEFLEGGNDAKFKKGKEPKDTNRILFFVGSIGGHNPFPSFGRNAYYDSKTDKANTQIMVASLNLKMVAAYNLKEAAEILFRFDDPSTKPKEIGEAIALLYGNKTWLQDNRDKFIERFSKATKKLLEGMKDYKLIFEAVWV